MFEGPIHPVLLKLGTPIFAGMMFQLLYNITDIVWISRIDLNDPSYVGGTGMIFPIIFLAIALGNGILIGVSSLVARGIGRKDHEILERTAESGFVIAAVFSVIILIVGYVFGARLVGLLGAAGDYEKHALEYLYMITPAAVIMFFLFVFNGILQGEGLMKRVMQAMIVGTIANIILDPVFILVLDMGVRGAAVATDIAQLLSLVYVVRVFLKGQSSVTVKWSHRYIDLKVMKEIAAVGLPQVVSQLSMSVSFLIFNRVVIGIDPLALTAFSLCGRFDQIVIMPVFALGAALLTMVGQNWGRGNFERVRKIWWTAVFSAIIVVMAMATILFVLAPVIYPLFTGIPEVVRYAVLQTRIMEYTFVFVVLGILARSAFQAVGKPIPALVITVLRLLVIAVPAVYFFVLVMDLGIIGVFLGLITGNVIAAVISLVVVPREIGKRLKAPLSP